MAEVKHLPIETLTAGLDAIRQSPKATGVLELIVRRPQTEAREVLDVGELDLAEGLVGDNWKQRGSSQTADRSAHPDMQLTLTNARLMALVAQEKQRWPLAGDQLYVDFDLSADNVPPGTRLSIGAAEIQITEPTPHRLQKIRRSLWARRPEICQFPGGQTASATRRQRQGHSPRRDTGWRCREENA